MRALVPGNRYINNKDPVAICLLSDIKKKGKTNKHNFFELSEEISKDFIPSFGTIGSLIKIMLKNIFTRIM